MTMLTYKQCPEFHIDLIVLSKSGHENICIIISFTLEKKCL